MAATISAAVGGSAPPEAVEAGRQQIPADCWLSRQLTAATTIAKQADSVPAMVGAISGALAGVDRLPAAWRTRAAMLRGVCVPELQGVSLPDLADKLISAAGQDG